LARRLDFLAVVAAIVVVCRVALDEGASWVPWALAFVAIVLLALTRWPYGALFVLIGMSVMPRFFVQLFGWKARPEHFAVAIISIMVAVWLLRHKQKIRFENLDYWVLAYVAINYLSSAFGSSVPSATLRWALMNNLAVLPYFLIRLLVRDRATLEKTFRILLGVGIAESAYGILCYLSHHVFATSFGMEIGQYFVDVAAPYGSLYEPNLFGAYTACCTVLFLALYLIERQNQFGYLICIIVTSLATVLSFSRGALLALVVAVAWVFWRTRRQQNARRGTLTTLVPALAFILIITAGVMGGVLQERIANLFQQGLSEETTITRLLVIQESLQDVPNHLLLGTGTASLQLSFDWSKYVPEWSDQATWVGNVGVRILHDVGLVGLAVFLGFLVSLWLKIRGRLHGQDPMLLGLSAGGLIYGISFQSTDGTTLAFCWIHLGLLASAALLVNSPAGNSGVY
jgi:O-antigen ligase